MTNKNKINTLLATLAILSLSLPSSTKAAEIAAYKLEQGIPFIGGAGQTLNYGEFSTLFQKFITAVYIIAAIAAFIKIFIAGLRWYASGGSSKAISQSREDIKNALIGLAFLFLAGALLVFINPNLNKLSKVFNPNGGTQCVQGGNSINGGGSVVTGTLALIDGYYVQPVLVDKLSILANPGVAGAAATRIGLNITTGCTKNDGTCDPNYCENDCHPCVIGGSKCTTLTNASCHFNGSCVDLTPSNGDYVTTIMALHNAGLDVFYEPKDGSCGKSTATHLHVSIPSSKFVPNNTTEKCWCPASAFVCKNNP